MKRILYLFFFFISFLVSAFPQNLNGRISSSYYTFERFDSASSSEKHIRAFQSVILNLNKNNFSLRTFLNLEHDIINPQLGDPRLRLYNFYLEGRDLLKAFTIKLGRQPLFNSVAAGLFDGINIDYRKDSWLLTGYYGFNVPAYQKFKISSGWNNDFIAGGKFSTSAINNFFISLEYINKNFKPQEYWATRLDADLNPIQVLIRNNSNQFQFLSAYVIYNLENVITFDSRYNYDLNFKQTSRFELSGTYEQLENIHFTAYYNYRAPLIRYNSIFSVFDYGNTQEYELGADYFFNKSVWFSARYGNVKYRDDNSQRASLGLNTDFGSISYRKTFGYSGELDALSLYSARSFFEGIFTPSAGISYTSYRLAAGDQKNNLTTILAGFNYRPFRILSFDLQGQYMDNKIYRNDFRIFLKANYWFNTNF